MAPSNPRGHEGAGLLPELQVTIMLFGMKFAFIISAWYLLWGEYYVPQFNKYLPAWDAPSKRCSRDGDSNLPINLT